MTKGPSLGTCCTCAKAPATVIMMLNRHGPADTYGWGCVVCGIQGGAVAVLCDDCAHRVAVGMSTVRLVVKGYPQDNVRVAIEQLPPGWFGHDPAAHMHDAVTP